MIDVRSAWNDDWEILTGSDEIVSGCVVSANGFGSYSAGGSASETTAWGPLADASWYEVEAGELAALRLGGGDYATATIGCSADNATGLQSTVSGLPDPGADGYWYLVRGVNCKGKGTYDSTGPLQLGSRDAGIAGSGRDCP